MIDYRLADGRFRTRAEGRTTWHSFSFGTHYDPSNTHLGPLVAHNDEVLPRGTGYAAHHHAELDIVTWVLEGALRHTSAVGEGVVRPGQVQRLRAGTGVVHAEVAHEGPTRFLQAWVRPDESDLEPGYVKADVPTGEGWTCVAGDGGLVDLASEGTSMWVSSPAAGTALDLPDAALLHVFVARGEVLLGERVLRPGDAARLTDEGARSLAAEADAHLVTWSFRG